MSLDDLIKQPRSIQDTGIDGELLVDLTLKHFYDCGVLDLRQIADRMALSGTVMESILDPLRKDSKVEVLAAKDNSAGVRFQLTDLGRYEAQHAFNRSAYIGRVPISIQHYRELVAEQSVFNGRITKAQLSEDFAGVVIEAELLNQLGPAIHSGRAIMVYGVAGSGKTYICKRMARSLGAPVHLPYAICVGREIIQFFDPLIHHPVYSVTEKATYQFQTQIDKRLILCERPVAISGGELGLDSLELQYDTTARFNQAPIQLKANNGLYLVDDLGRQRISVMDLLNRWIVPMEEHVDYLTLGTGQHFPVPFDVVLIFSTNIDPTELLDEAFLRRLGYKVKFSAIDKSAYSKIWANMCAVKNIAVETGVLEQVIEWYETKKRALLPCQPRDLLEIGLNLAHFNNENTITKETMRLAWSTYFIQLNIKDE